jgi:iron complex transport system substrate-binding protein
MLLLLAALLSACTAGATDTAAPPTPTATAAQGPERIVSLSPTATEMLFAISAGEQVVAVDDQSDYPEEAPMTDLSGFEPSVEAIAAYEPDLVVLSDDPGDVVAGLEALDVEVLVLPAAITLDDTFDQIARLGEATGQEGEAAETLDTLRARLEALSASVPEREASPLTYYHELGPELYTATSSTFIGEIYSLAGLENVADPADAEGQAGGYPQLSAEFLVRADPDFIFLADTECCGQTAATVAERPGFAEMSAVREGRVVELSDDVASRWGPRVADLLETVIEASAAVPAGA